MNYYRFHIGDYVSATAHLSWDEDAAYRRLLDHYYSKEQPIPADIKQVCRIVRATTKGQRQAVTAVLGEFFDLRDDGWHQDRCDKEIAEYQDRKASHWTSQLSRSEKTALQAIRQAQKLNATPRWLSDEQLAEINALYARSSQMTRETGVVHHVDHIVPLRGKTVCGLHVPWNLQVITAAENLQKSNKEGA